MNKSAKITLSMIVKNEEKYLSGCLESVKDIVDEIIIVDTGSSDNTLKIAEEFGAKTFHFNWINDFSAARNFALSKSSGEWILYLDADERLLKKSLSELRELTEQDEFIGYKCIVKSLDDNNDRPHLMKYVRLFRNIKGIKFTGKVHEQIENSLIKNKYKIHDSNIEITHLGYNVSEDEIQKKALRNLNLLIKEYDSDKTVYNAFQLGNTFNVLKDLENAKKYYLEAVKQNNLKKEYLAYAYLNLAEYELKNYNLKQALQYINEGLLKDPHSVLLKMLASDIYFRVNRADEAINFCKEALKLNREIISGIRKAELAVELKSESIITKGVYFSLLSGNKKYLDYFLQKLETENKSFFNLIMMIRRNKSLTEIEKEKLLNYITNDNIDAFLIIISEYSNKPAALDILKKLEQNFFGNSKFHTALGLLYYENNFLTEAVEKFKESLSSKEKDPSAVFYYISVLVSNNKFEEIPDLLLFAEKEFGKIPEFAEKFEILKEKLSALFPS